MLAERFPFFPQYRSLQSLDILALRLQRRLLNFKDFAARRNRAIDGERRVVVLGADELIPTDDHLVRIPRHGITDSGLAQQAVEVADQILQFPGVGEQSDDLHRRRRLLRGANVGTHQAFKNHQGFVGAPEIGVDPTQPETRLGPELRVLCGDLQRVNGPLLFLRGVLHDGRPADAEIAAAGIFTLRKFLETLGKRLLGLRVFLAQQVAESEVELEQFQRRVLGRPQILQQLLDLRDGTVVVLRSERGFRFREHAVERAGGDDSSRGSGWDIGWRVGLGLQLCRRENKSPRNNRRVFMGLSQHTVEMKRELGPHRVKRDWTGIRLGKAF